MGRAALAGGLLVVIFAAGGFAGASPATSSTDPLVAIDLNRTAIVADIVGSFDAEFAQLPPADRAREAGLLAKRLAGLRADRLLAASLASTRESLESILVEAESSRDAVMSRASAKALGSATSDLVYTPLTPCRLVDTRGFGAPFQGGPFAPNERRAYVPNGNCAIPLSGVTTLLMTVITQNLTPNSGGYLAILPPGAPVTGIVDIFNITPWSAANTAVATGSAGQFDVFVNSANPHVVIDVVGYFAPPQGGAVTSITAGTGLSGGTITSTGTVAIATAYQLPQACTIGQVAQSNGAGSWSCATPASGGTVTGVSASAPLASSGGNTPNISLSGTIPVGSGGTGQSTLAVNGIIYGQGAAAVGTAVGTVGQVLAGTAFAPAWTGSPSISGNLTLPSSSTAGAGNIMKGGNLFIHNFGSANTFIGFSAGNTTMTGGFNTASGMQALLGNTTGINNTASGYFALGANTTGSNNSADGQQALLNNTAGSANTASGSFALLANTIGDSNTAAGATALQTNTTGSNNTAIAVGALVSNTTGSNNIALGRAAGLALTTGDNNIHIGNFGVAAEGGTIRIGDLQTRAFVAGIRGVGTGIMDAINVVIDSAGQLGTVSSSRRFKDDIADMEAASHALMKLRPVTFPLQGDRNPSDAPSSTA
jgi:hypothetical protein